jgi:hypothetical protein
MTAPATAELRRPRRLIGEACEGYVSVDRGKSRGQRTLGRPERQSFG